MFNNLLQINPKEEEKRIVSFLAQTFSEQKIEKAVIAVSGGVDSAISLTLLSKAIPKKDIVALHLPYFNETDKEAKTIEDSLDIKISTRSIKKSADEMFENLEIAENDLVRRGNIMARLRMIILYDFAKKENGLVVGTENRSEYHLGYFTRFGDEASDVEPIQHLYKTQVLELARYLGLPPSIINKKPSAGLWQNQTDEGEFGFTYQEADPVLYLFYDKKNPLWEIEKMFPGAKRIIEFAKKNEYKHHTPYHL